MCEKRLCLAEYEPIKWAENMTFSIPPLPLWFQFYLKTFSVWFERPCCFNTTDLIKNTWFSTCMIHCALDTALLCPTPRAQWITFNFSGKYIWQKLFLFCGSKTKCSLFIHNNHTHLLTTKWITLYKLLGETSKTIFFYPLCPHSPYLLTKDCSKR